MRRRRDWILLVFLQVVCCQYIEKSKDGYNAVPIPSVVLPPAPPLPPRAPTARGYQPPPHALLFEGPRSYYQNQNGGFVPASNRPHHHQSTSQGRAQFQNRHNNFNFAPPKHAPHNSLLPVPRDDWRMEQLQQQFPEAFSMEEHRVRQYEAERMLEKLEKEAEHAWQQPGKYSATPVDVPTYSTDFRQMNRPRKVDSPPSKAPPEYQTTRRRLESDVYVAPTTPSIVVPPSPPTPSVVVPPAPSTTSSYYNEGTTKQQPGYKTAEPDSYQESVVVPPAPSDPIVITPPPPPSPITRQTMRPFTRPTTRLTTKPTTRVTTRPTTRVTTRPTTRRTTTFSYYQPATTEPPRGYDTVSGSRRTNYNRNVPVIVPPAPNLPVVPSITPPTPPTTTTFSYYQPITTTEVPNGYDTVAVVVPPVPKFPVLIVPPTPPTPRPTTAFTYHSPTTTPASDGYDSLLDSQRTGSPVIPGVPVTVQQQVEAATEPHTDGPPASRPHPSQLNNRPPIPSRVIGQVPKVIHETVHVSAPAHLQNHNPRGVDLGTVQRPKSSFGLNSRDQWVTAARPSTAPGTAATPSWNFGARPRGGNSVRVQPQVNTHRIGQAPDRNRGSFATIPGFVPHRHNPPTQQQVDATIVNSREKNMPNMLNNIIVHIYLSAKDRSRPSHAQTKIGPIHGAFGIGTSHGGPGTHSDPIVITKDFDRDRLQFVEQGMAEMMAEDGSSNIVEVHAMVSSPDQKIKKTLDKAVNTELDRSIPVVLERFHGTMAAMDDDLRKELEQALVDEIARNLGDTIDEMSEVTEEDLGALIEEGFNAIEAELASSTTRSPAPTTRRITVTSSTATATTETSTKKTTKTPMTNRVETTPTTTRRTTTVRPTTTTTAPPTSTVTTLETAPSTSRTPPPRTYRIRTTTPTTTAPSTTDRTTTLPQVETTTMPATEKTTELTTTRATTTEKPTTQQTVTTTKPTTTVGTSTTQPSTTTTKKQVPVDFEHESVPETHSVDQQKEPTSTNQPIISKTTKTASFAEDNMMRPEDHPMETTVLPETNELNTVTIPLPTSSEERELETFVPPFATESGEQLNIVTSRPITIVNIEESGEGPSISAPATQDGGTESSAETTPVDASYEQTTKSKSSIFDESAFEHLTPSTSSATTKQTTPSTTTTHVFIAPPAPTVTHSMEEYDDDYEKEDEAEIIVKPAPQSFGEMNMMMRETMAEEETQTSEKIGNIPVGETQTSKMPEIIKQQKVKTSEELETTTTAEAETFEEPETVRRPETQTPEELETMHGGETQMSKEPETMQGGEAQTPELPETMQGGEPQTPEEPETTPVEETQTSKMTMQGGETTGSQTETTETPFETEPDMFQVTATVELPGASTSVEQRDEDVEPLPDSVVMPNGACPTPNDLSDRNKSDVLFLLDSSNSFNEDKFMHAITLILHTVDQFNNIGPDGIQVSLVQYNNDPYLEFSLRKHNCKQFLKDDIADTDYMMGGQKLGKALEKVSKFAFTKKRGDRPDAENILVIVTDGQSDDRVQQPITIARDNNVTVLVIATLEADPNYLMKLTGDVDNVFHLDGTPNQPLAYNLADRINRVSNAPPSKTGAEDGMVILPHRQPIDANELEEERPVPPMHIISSNDPLGMVHLVCASGGFKINFNVPSSFAGHAVVKGQENEDSCKKDIRPTNDVGNRTVEFFVAKDACGMTEVTSLNPPGANQTLILQLLHDPFLRTDIDRAFLLQCFTGVFETETELSTNLDVVKSEVMIAETISLSSIPPTCMYSIRKDSPHGAVIAKATVGQKVYHRWDCDGGDLANNVYGIQIHNCYASDDIEQKYPIVDATGCSSDISVLADPVYEDDKLSAYAESHAFGFKETESLKFVCKLSLCTRDGDGCEGVTPPTCNSNHSDLLFTRRIRHQNSALETALTSALSTEVGLSTGSLHDKIVDLAGSHHIWVLAIMTIVAIVVTVFVSRHAGGSDASTSCSDTEMGSGLDVTRDSSSEFNSSASEGPSTISGPPVNPRLAEFMRTFDRDRYV